MANFCKDNCLNERCKQCLTAIEELISTEILYESGFDDFEDTLIYTGLDQIDWIDENDYPEYR